MHATAKIKHIGNLTTVKRVEHYLEYGVFDREVQFLARLERSGFTPKLQSVDWQKSEFTMERVGDELCRHNFPKDAGVQASAILATLESLAIRHNDIRPSNVTVRAGKLFLIDWQWATLETLPPAYWPKGLGTQFRAGWPKWEFDDRVSFQRVLGILG